jgi:hypothetical protein
MLFLVFFGGQIKLMRILLSALIVLLILGGCNKNESHPYTVTYKVNCQNNAVIIVSYKNEHQEYETKTDVPYNFSNQFALDHWPASKELDLSVGANPLNAFVTCTILLNDSTLAKAEGQGNCRATNP